MQKKFVLDYYKEWERISVFHKETRTKTRQFLEQSKTNKRCFDCNRKLPPYMLCYDHIQDDKLGNVTDIARGGTMEELVAEIAKCELICLNCHAHRTYMRAKGLTFDITVPT